MSCQADLVAIIQTAQDKVPECVKPQVEAAIKPAKDAVAALQTSTNKLAATLPLDNPLIVSLRNILNYVANLVACLLDNLFKRVSVVCEIAGPAKPALDAIAGLAKTLESVTGLVKTLTSVVDIANSASSVTTLLGGLPLSLVLAPVSSQINIVVSARIFLAKKLFKFNDNKKIFVSFSSRRLINSKLKN